MNKFKFNRKNKIDNIFFFDKNFDYINFENDIITPKIKNNSGWILTLEEAYFINGLIRKYRPLNCLEIGIAAGGSSILILNAIKDYSNSSLVSIDLFEYYRNYKIGYLVEKNFPELMKNWKMYLGEMPCKVLSRLNIKFDFLFLDTAHISPGEFFNIIEALPFLKENAIIVLHDVKWHLKNALITNKTLLEAKLMPTQIYLLSALIGEKILIKKKQHDFANIGAVCLSKNQEKFYLNYFLLLMNIWQYIPKNYHLNVLRDFIKKYYSNNNLLLRIFDNSVYYNKKFFENIKERKYRDNI